MIATPQPITATMTARPCRWIRDTQPVVSAPTRAPAPGAAYRNPSVAASPPNRVTASAGNSARGMPNTMALMSMMNVLSSTRLPLRKRRPSRTDWSPARVPPPSGGSACMGIATAKATTNVDTSIQ